MCRSLSSLLVSWLVVAAGAAEPLREVRSPGGVLTLQVFLEHGQLSYALSRLQRPVLERSALGLQWEDRQLAEGLRLLDSRVAEVDETWEQPWGEQRLIRNHHRELQLELATVEDHRLTVTFRVFDDGLGFRYAWPEDGRSDREGRLRDERTEFRLAGDATVWWTQAYQDNRYEYLYTRSPLAQMSIAHTPLTMETADGLYVSIHEAALVDYPSMTLERTGGTTLKANLVPWAGGALAYTAAPGQSPWRTVQVADTPGGLVTSYLILNLNEPSRIADTSWIEPGKYLGIWWGMHIGTQTWAPGPLLGATTETVRQYLDFAADHGFGSVLVEGWNVGWDQAWWDGQGDKFQFTDPQPAFDMEVLSAHARERGVRIIGHHETGAVVDNYEAQLEDALAYAARHGQNAIKTGYVGTRLTTTTGQREWHHGQFGVRHYQKTVEAAARHQIMLNIHEPIKDTGLRRTWPNLMTREGMRGMEYDAWSGDGGNPPEHHVLLPFTRNLAGPFDYTPGVLALFFPETRPQNRVNMTVAKGLALYVTIYSPLHMVADLPENLAGHPALPWLQQVPTDWETTVVLDARLGDYVVIARQDRHGPDWYLGAITDEVGRQLEVPLTFLEPDVTYRATRYEDAPDGDWRTREGALALVISESEFRRGDTLRLRLAPGGGAAVRFAPQGD